MEVAQNRGALGPHISARKTAYRTLVFNCHTNEKETSIGALATEIWERISLYLTAEGTKK